MKSPLTVLETHPVQYHAPVYRALAKELGVDVTAVYGSDFSVQGYQDKEFGASFAWDTDLLGGMRSHFIGRVSEGGAANYESVTGRGVASAMQTLAPSVVMALGYAHPFDRAVLKSARQQSIPLLFRGETSDHARQRGLIKTLLRDWMLRALYKRCSGLLYVGERSRAHYRRLGVPDSRLFFSPYCVETTTFQSTDEDRTAMRKPTRQRLGIAEDAIVILYSGKLSERKGVDLLPQAVRLLPSAIQRRAHLLFIGDGALRSALEQECQNAPQVSTTFTGFQNQSALSALYHAADLLVLPSRSMETWGLVVNEALMHGLPCVVSQGVGSQPDLVIPGKTGSVSAGDDAHSLARALNEVMDWFGNEGVPGACRSQVAPYIPRRAAEGIFQAMKSLQLKS
ncbi:MAG: glycosyltransferase [Verrucomicrobiaceae bacterium]|nr:glycosyltransferase [Verrucomicrobiaceae bacterium]